MEIVCGFIAGIIVTLVVQLAWLVLSISRSEGEDDE